MRKQHEHVLRNLTAPLAALVQIAILVTAALGTVAQTANAQDSDTTGAWMAAHTDREDMVWIPMHDGTRLNATLLFPKNTPRQNLPTVLIFNPYLTNHMIQGFTTPGSWSSPIASLIRHGYVIAIVNTRGRYFSGGTYTYYVGSGKDTYDVIDWIARQPWSNGNVGADGCSSSAEEQNAMNAMQNPHFAAAVPMSSGAGIGHVGPYDEMGNFFRGGVVQDLWFDWYHNAGWKYRPSFPAGLSREDMLRLEQYWNLQPEHIPQVNLDSLIWTLPETKIISVTHMAPSSLDDFLTWPINDPRWKTVGFPGEGDRNGAPALYINAWYDVSTGPNLAMFQYQTKHAANATARNNTFMIIAPTLHCQQLSASAHTVVGERDMGDARFDYVGFIQRWYDHWLKGVDNGVEKEPRVRAYLMGANEWRTYNTWPPAAAKPVTYYLDSNGSANTRAGDGQLTTVKPNKAGEDRYTYDPLHPTPTVGGQTCCYAAAKGGAYDQSKVEMRRDVLVYTSPPLKAPLDVTGSIPVTLYLSSDVKDTDLMVKLVDVYPDGKAYNLDEQALRVRYREGYDKQVFMEPDHVYRVDLPPLVTSNEFLTGHRIRIAIASSDFPMLERNLNTGGPNYNEKDPVIAHNVIHHGGAYLSEIVLPVLPQKASSKR